jgi:S-adenosylmethionine decarboxylase
MSKPRIIEYDDEYLNLNEIYDDGDETEINEQYLLTDDKFVYAGRHLLFDFLGSPHINNSEFIAKALVDAVASTGATILHQHFHHFGEEGGITGVLVLEESHASIHTWTEANLMTFDVYMCGHCNPEQAYEYLKEVLQPKEIHILSTRRGIVKKF